jgi:hypothetical protein
MARAPSEIKDNTSFMLEFDRHGWCRFHVFEEKTSFCYWVSDVFSDFSNDMLSLCEHVLENKPVRIALCDEPGGAIVALEPNPKQHHIVEISIEEIDGSVAGFGPEQLGNIVLRVVMRRKQVIANIVSELWKVHYLLKEPSYQKERSRFPHERLIKLNRTWDKGDLGPSFLK